MRTVAVYSDADANALHVAACDEAFRIGPPPPRESYLAGDAIIAVARRSGAQAIHPGYGFLSENEAFAAACARAGLVFIGPPPAAIAAMGSKSAAKAIMERAGVPVVPGYHDDDQDASLLAREAARIGYPVLIKATSGGGGKGMKVAATAGEFAAALASAKREAKASFGDDRVLLERYLQAPRHIEIQVFADTQGNVVHLFERDCSVQRRHQKVLEEAPAPGMPADRRRAMGDAAVAAANGDRLRRRGHGRVHRRAGRHVLLHGDEHAAAGRASGDGDDHRARPRRMAAAGRGGRAAAAHAADVVDARPRDRGAHLRGGSRPRIPAVDRADRALADARRNAARARRYRVSRRRRGQPVL